MFFKKLRHFAVRFPAKTKRTHVYELVSLRAKPLEQSRAFHTALPDWGNPAWYFAR